MQTGNITVISSLDAEILDLHEDLKNAQHLPFKQFLPACANDDDWLWFFLTAEEYKEICKSDFFKKIPLKLCILLLGEEPVNPEVLDLVNPVYTVPFTTSTDQRNFFLKQAFRQCLEHGIRQNSFLELQGRLARESRKLKELNEIGKSLTSIADPYVLMNLILKKSRELTNADAGSICVIHYDNNDNPMDLVYSYFQNDTLEQDMKVDLCLPVSKKSLSGYVALSGEVLNIKDSYNLPEDAEYRFNPDVDKSTGYRTKSQLVHPMVDTEGRILGIVQLINKKSDHYTPMTDGSLNVNELAEFAQGDVEIIHSLTSQAAICLKNTTLIQEIQELFEGFVNASVTAIEQRDPTTSGHSVRVALMTTELARRVSLNNEGTYRHISYNENEMQEIRYSSLLHDFGKIGVREKVLIKAKKLFPYELDTIRMRFDYILKSVETKSFEKSYPCRKSSKHP